jgi:hypothetical protein
VHANNADPKVLAYKYLEMLPRLAEGGNGYFVIPGEFTEAVKTVTSAFAADRGPKVSDDPPRVAPTEAIGPATRPQAVEAATRAAATARAAVDEARAEAEQAQRNLLG